VVIVSVYHDERTVEMCKKVERREKKERRAVMSRLYSSATMGDDRAYIHFNWNENVGTFSSLTEKELFFFRK
jgi:hypothetical protein